MNKMEKRFKQTQLPLYIFVFLITIISCTRADRNHLYFTKEDLKFCNAYKQNDTLVFEGANSIDALIIHRIDSSRGNLTNYSSFFTIEAGFNRKKGDSLVEEKQQVFFSIHKYSTSRSIHFNVNYSDFFTSMENHFGNFHAGKTYFHGVELRNYYVLKPLYNKPENYIVKMYWTLQEGLVAYEAKDKMYWIKRGVGKNKWVKPFSK